MYDDEMMKMVEYAFCHCCFIIDIVVSDNDITIRAVTKNISRGARGKVLKSSKGKLDEKIPVPSLLADLYHSVKVFATSPPTVVNDDKTLRCGCTRADSIRLNKYWGYKVKKNIIKV